MPTGHAGADARARLGDAAGGLADCDAALAAEPAHPGALLSKGALLRGLGLYAAAADCFRAAALASGGGAAADDARELAEQCRRLEAQARSGVVDLSEWVLRARRVRREVPGSSRVRRVRGGAPVPARRPRAFRRETPPRSLGTARGQGEPERGLGWVVGRGLAARGRESRLGARARASRRRLGRSGGVRETGGGASRR